MNRVERDLVESSRPRAYADLVASGTTPYALRTSRWERTSRGLYVVGGTARSAVQRVVSAAGLMPPEGLIGGWAAALVLGADFVDGFDQGRRELPVDVLLPPGIHRLHVPGVRYRRVGLAAEERAVAGGLRVTSPLRTAVDLACWATSVTEATVALDLMLAAGLGRADLGTAHLHGRRGAVQARTAIARARAGSRSPGETRVRLLYLDEAPGARLLLNPTLLDAYGRVVAMPDVFDEEAGVALEYDGASWDAERADGHLDPAQHREDNVREEAMERLGAIVVRVGSADVGPHRRQTAYRFRQARLDGLARDRGRDRWILRPNPADR